jgi:SAM-dependent methyltransferase
MVSNDYDSFAGYFDLFSGQAIDDLPVYAGFAQRTGGPVLEMGCGTGRLVLEMARAGLAVTGVDNSSAMLALARRKIEQAGLLNRVTLVQADLCDLDLAPGRLSEKGVTPGRPYKLAICAQNTFCHMLSTADQVGLLHSAGWQLEIGGLLVLDVFNPDPAALVSNDRRLTLMGVATDPGTGHTLAQTMAREIDTGEQIEHVTLFVDEMEGSHWLGRRVFQFDLRYVFRFELELLLDKAGFALEALYGSYDLEPFEADSQRLLAVARCP